MEEEKRRMGATAAAADGVVRRCVRASLSLCRQAYSSSMGYQVDDVGSTQNEAFALKRERALASVDAQPEKDGEKCTIRILPGDLRRRHSAIKAATPSFSLRAVPDDGWAFLEVFLSPL